MLSSTGSSQPRDQTSTGSSQPRDLKLQADSLWSEPPGKPKNTRVGNLSSGYLPSPETEPGSPTLQTDYLLAELQLLLLLIFSFKIFFFKTFISLYIVFEMCETRCF